MNAVKFQLYRFAFWLASTMSLSMWRGTTKAFEHPD